MPLKNVDEQLNESSLNTKSGVYFFASKNSEKVHYENKQNASKRLKSSNPIKYSTVFKVDKVNLSVTDEEIEITKTEEELTISTLEEAKEKVAEQKTHRSKWFNAVFFVINLLVLAAVLIYQGSTFGVASLDVLKESARFSILFYTVLLFVFIMIVETLRTHILIYKSTRQFRPFLCYKASALCRYYDCITPFATGGQPFEMFYLHSRGVNSGIATSVPLTKAIYNNVAFIMVSVFVLICNSKIFTGQEQNLIIVWGIISLCISCLVLAILVLFAISKKFMPKCLMFVLKLGRKIGVVKNERLLFTKWMRTILEYQKSTKHYIANIWVTVSSVLCSAVIVIVKAFIPVMLYWAFHTDITSEIVLEILSKFILIELATKYIPIPGGSGVAEISFSALFAVLFEDGTLFWGMLFWRILNYFSYLLQGIIVIAYDFAYGNKKNRIYRLKMKEKEQEIINKTKRAKLNNKK